MAKSHRNGDELSMVQKLFLRRREVDNGQTPPDEEFCKQAPKLFELLTCNRLDKNYKCAPARLSVRAVGGDWVFTLSCPMVSGIVQVVTRTFAEGIPALEAGLTANTLAWRFFDDKKIEVSKRDKRDFKDLDL